MKSIIAFTALSTYANAAATTYNNCLNEEGVIHLGACRSLWYKICDNYTILPAETCNVETFGDASIAWFSDSVKVYVWNYVERLKSMSSDSSSPSSDNWQRLRQSNNSTMSDDGDSDRECVAESLGSN